MPRPINLALFSNSSRPAHHSIYIPSLTSPSLGKIIHVTGNPAVGFFLQFKRNYDISLDDRKYQLLELGMADEKVVRDDKGGEEVVDTIARDRIEGVALGVEVPGKSSRPFGDDVRNCQDWIVDFVEKSIEEGYLDAAAREVVRNAPKKM